VLALVASLAACTGGKPTDRPASKNLSSATPPGTATDTGSAAASGTASNGCAPYAPYLGHSGTTVTIFGPLIGPDSNPLITSWAEFEQCTGISIAYEGSDDFATRLPSRVHDGNPPDLAIIDGPRQLASLVATGAVKQPPLTVSADVDKYDNPAWKQAGSVDGTFYAAPLGANVKSLVWYSPSRFADAGYQVPTTWAALMALTDKIAADHPGVKPWCGGLAAGADTGWLATDWLEEVVLGKYGVAVYDSWARHELAFNSPQIEAAMRIVADWMGNPRYVNGGFGDPATVATTTANDAGKPILSGQCWMMQQGFEYRANWSPGTKIGPDGDVFAFVLPAVEAKMPAPVEVTGTFAVAFASRPEVQAVQTYLSSARWATARVQAGAGWVSASTAVGPSGYADPVDRLAAAALSAKDATVRYDASELMPAAVGSVAEPALLASWFGRGDSIGQDAAIDAVTQAIDAAWPAPVPASSSSSPAGR
jgi:alpha-glucoside transport system substrate-binding protein